MTKQEILNGIGIQPTDDAMEYINHIAQFTKQENLLLLVKNLYECNALSTLVKAYIDDKIRYNTLKTEVAKSLILVGLHDMLDEDAIDYAGQLVGKDNVIGYMVANGFELPEAQKDEYKKAHKDNSLLD